ncbi:uncharacterized protein LOC142554801 [Primulina tabacum]|uniref:uncharacterized protein LOC142554801 n=1 Tax=Primulina tabacum TaxID=48773 RepID=UPI003F5964D4
MNKPHFNKDHTDDGQACFNCGKKGHFIAECNRPIKDEKKSGDRRRVKDNKRFIKKKSQRVLVAEENKDLVTALHDMVDEFKRLSQQFNEAKTEKQNLENKLTLSSCSQQKEVNGLKVSKKKNLEESIWFLDSGCSRHMTGSKDLLSEVIKYKGPTITFGDNSKGKAVGKDHGIKHELSAARSPQQNGVAERRNRTLKEAARTMLAEYGISQRYSTVSKAYRVYNQRTLTVEEYIHIVFDESSICHDNNSNSIHDLINNLDATNLEASSDDEVDLRKIGEITSKEKSTVQEQTQQVNEPEDIQQTQMEVALEQEEEITQPTELNPYVLCLQWKKDHPLELVIGNPTAPLRTRNQLINEVMHAAFVPQIEPKKIDDALLDSNWIEAMHEELNQFERSKVWHLVPRPNNTHVIMTRWVFRNKMDENGLIIRNKARLVAQSYRQEEEQPPGFINHIFPDYVYKLDKALYGLKQAPRAWYDTFTKFLLEHGFSIGTSENEIFINQAKYTRDMLKKFGMENCSPASTPMSSTIKLDKDEGGISVDTKMYRGLIGSLLYLTASRPDIMFAVCLCARFQAKPMQSHFIAAKRILKYLKETANVGLWYPKDSSLNLVGYSDADYAGCKVDRKSTSGSCQFLDERAIAITYNPVMHSRTKHIDIRHHFILEHVMKKEIRLEYVHTDQQTADIFTKPLPEAKFSYFRNMLGLIDLS